MNQDDPLRDVRVVLVETSHPGNIGAVARAMKNMGLSRLVLVNPSEFPHEKAYARSAGASDILRAARVVPTLDEAISDCVQVVGASARSRSLTWPVINPREGAERVWQARSQGPVALVFGREDSGLSNSELQRCHFHVHIPANPDYSSLNLAMAVQVISYELRMHYLHSAEGAAEAQVLRPILTPGDEGWGETPATVAEFEGFLQHLEKSLIMTGFHNPERPRQLMMRLRRLYQRARMDRNELAIMRGILTSVDKVGQGSGTQGEGHATASTTDKA
ncbi:MAG: tRNA (cytosine(32)/uridine(32)-2'-O)-methyltransferase TrmJ [Halomonadaceae bacterium]|nr:MAG: tRNA (cytosine(32)/uridine(32)-2'-O)-methyltransferase TrmJ [Halomonadaceae bacterium]